MNSAHVTKVLGIAAVAFAMNGSTAWSKGPANGVSFEVLRDQIMVRIAREEEPFRFKGLLDDLNTAQIRLTCHGPRAAACKHAIESYTEKKRTALMKVTTPQESAALIATLTHASENTPGPFRLSPSAQDPEEVQYQGTPLPLNTFNYANVTDDSGTFGFGQPSGAADAGSPAPAPGESLN